MRLFFVNCGYYLPENEYKFIEMHSSFFVIARSPEEAKTKVKNKKVYKELDMHVDGMVEIQKVDGYAVHLVKEDTTDETILRSYNYTDINRE